MLGGCTSSNVIQQLKELYDTGFVKREWVNLQHHGIYKYWVVEGKALPRKHSPYEGYREEIKLAVKKAMTLDPRLSINTLAKVTGYSNSIVSRPYYQFKRGEL